MKDENHATLADHLQVAIFNPHYAAVPKDVLNGLCRYALDGTDGGGFILSVLKNDLFGAVGQADRESFAALKEILTFVKQELPAECWGDRLKVVGWLWARMASEEDIDQGYDDRPPPKIPMKGDEP